jgi:hypothetical protein
LYYTPSAQPIIARVSPSPTMIRLPS